MSYAALLKAKGAIAKGAKTTAMWQNVFSDIAAAGTFVAGQAKKSKTAWGEYEKGYEQISGGKKADISGESWLKRTFGKPEGEVDIGGKEYSMENLRKVGGVLSSDIASLVSADTLNLWAEKVASGGLTTEVQAKDQEDKKEKIEKDKRLKTKVTSYEDEQDEPVPTDEADKYGSLLNTSMMPEWFTEEDFIRSNQTKSAFKG